MRRSTIAMLCLALAPFSQASLSRADESAPPPSASETAPATMAEVAETLPPEEPTRPPAAPESLSAELGSGPSVNLSWEKADAVADVVVISRWSQSEAFDPTRIHAISKADEGKHVDIGPFQPATIYFYRAAAQNKSGRSGWSNTVSLRTPDFPAGVYFNKTEEPIQIDGALDALWEKDSPFRLPVAVEGAFDSSRDFGCAFKAFWDDDALYFVALVTDDKLVTGAPDSPAEGDSVEICLDIGYDREVGYGEDDFHYVLAYGADAIAELTKGATEGARLASRKVEGGYVVEASIPWKTLKLESPKKGALFGFGALANDDDGDGRKARIAWNTTAPEPASSPQNFPKAALDTPAPIGLEAWKKAFGVESDADDSDGDSIPALAEYFMGLDPRTPDNVAEHYRVEGADKGQRIIFSRAPYSSDARAAVQKLENGEWRDVTKLAGGERAGLIEFESDPGPGYQEYRVRVDAAEENGAD